MTNPNPAGRCRRRSLRLPDYDHGAAAWYFVTVCAHQRACRFGRVEAGETRLGCVGHVVRSTWIEIPARHPGVVVDAFVIMPNHIHGIIVLPGATWTLGSVIRAFKARVSHEVKRRMAPCGEVWQRNYYEHVIRADESLDSIRRYIEEDPARWDLDRENPEARAR